MRIVQLLASPFLGGPEYQVLGVADALAADHTTAFISFAEGGRATPLLNEARQRGFEAVALESNSPHLCAAVREVAAQLRRCNADLLCCSGYKPDVIGWAAARLAGVPVAAISHGWTGATVKVRLNEALDRRVLRWMDATVCVSEAQANKVRRAGVMPERVHVIRNALDRATIGGFDPEYRDRLRAFFPRTPQIIVGTAGRLSPEKGFEILIDAAAQARREQPGLGFIVFGDGPLRKDLERRIRAADLEGHFILAGFRADVRRFLPHFDMFALSSYTEGLPVALLEACAAGLPVVATEVGGVPEVIEEDVTGYLVPAGDAGELARRLLVLARFPHLRRSFGERGRERVQREFSLEVQGAQYRRLFESIAGHGVRAHGPKRAGAHAVC